MERTKRILDRLPLFYRSWDRDSIIFNLLFAMGKRIDEAEKEVTAIQIRRNLWLREEATRGRPRVQEPPEAGGD